MRPGINPVIRGWAWKKGGTSQVCLTSKPPSARLPSGAKKSHSDWHALLLYSFCGSALPTVKLQSTLWGDEGQVQFASRLPLLRSIQSKRFQPQWRKFHLNEEKLLSKSSNWTNQTPSPVPCRTVTSTTGRKTRPKSSRWRATPSRSSPLALTPTSPVT